MTTSIIQEGTSTVTLVNVFTVDPKDQQRLVERWQQATEEVIRHLPGFISANVHRSLDGTKVINYAQWESQEAFDAMRHNPEAARTSESSVRSGPRHPSCARWCRFTTSDTEWSSIGQSRRTQARRPNSGWAFFAAERVDRSHGAGRARPRPHKPCIDTVDVLSAGNCETVSAPRELDVAVHVRLEERG